MRESASGMHLQLFGASSWTEVMRWFVPIDLLASMLLPLSRFEELQSNERDLHGRFLAAQSLALKHNFLQRPIVDEYGLAPHQVYTYMMSAYRTPHRKLRVNN